MLDVSKTTSSVMNPRKRYTSYTIDDKIKFLLLCDSIGFKKAVIKCKLPLSTARDWRKLQRNDGYMNKLIGFLFMIKCSSKRKKEGWSRQKNILRYQIRRKIARIRID